MLDFIRDLHYRVFFTEDKCNKCKMSCHIISNTPDGIEYDSYCLYSSNRNDIEYCYIPLWFSRIMKATLYKNKCKKSLLDELRMLQK